MASTELQRIYHLLDPTPDELLLPHRFIREGAAEMADPKKKGKKMPKYLFLFHDILLLTTPQKKGNYKLNIIMDFKKKSLEVSTTDEALVIKSTSTDKVFEFFLEDKDGWFQDIQAGIELTLEAPVVGIQPLEGPYDPYNLQTDEQKAVFDQLRQKLQERDPPLTEKEVAWTDDACLCRYLRARQYDLEKSYKMLDNSLVWRSTFKPEQITADEVAEEMASGKVYVSTDRDWAGRPIVYMRPGKDTEASPETKVKFVVWILENAATIMDTNVTGVEKMTWLVDFTNSSIGAPSGDSVKVSMDTLHIVQDHYPERLGNAFMLNPPFVFSAFWKVLSPFIDPVTKQKVQFFKKKEEYKKLKLYIPEQCLEKEYGGTSEYVFNYEEWKARVDAAAPAASSTSSEGDAAASSTSGDAEAPAE